MWAYFALKTGWLKINVGTNVGPQIYMYLSALELHDAIVITFQRKCMCSDSIMFFNSFKVSEGRLILSNTYCKWEYILSFASCIILKKRNSFVAKLLYYVTFGCFRV